GRVSPSKIGSGTASGAASTRGSVIITSRAAITTAGSDGEDERRGTGVVSGMGSDPDAEAGSGTARGTAEVTAPEAAGSGAATAPEVTMPAAASAPEAEAAPDTKTSSATSAPESADASAASDASEGTSGTSGGMARDAVISPEAVSTTGSPTV